MILTSLIFQAETLLNIHLNVFYYIFLSISCLIFSYRFFSSFSYKFFVKHDFFIHLIHKIKISMYFTSTFCCYCVYSQLYTIISIFLKSLPMRTMYKIYLLDFYFITGAIFYLFQFFFCSKKVNFKSKSVAVD